MEHEKIFVGCSSRDVGNPNYNFAADMISGWIAAKGHELVLGGCANGLMGRVFKQVHGHSTIHAVQAQVYADQLNSLPDDESVKKYLIPTINGRKQFIYELASVLVFLPGGIGTVDEIMAAIESRRSHEIDKPIIIVNEGEYFQALIDMLEKAYKEGFASETDKQYYIVVDNTAQAIEKLTEICNK